MSQKDRQKTFKKCLEGSYESTKVVQKCLQNVMKRKKKKNTKIKLIDQNKFAIFCFEANLTFKKIGNYSMNMEMIIFRK